MEQVRELDEAVECDIEAWRKFTVIEAKRIMTFLDLPKHGGLDALEIIVYMKLIDLLNNKYSDIFTFKLRRCFK
ncbi:DUF6125 family protein [Desulfosporosinus nitroreducens]|uniref:DUF6125 family protein n=1 Tax=Desulfosporosinus nitroreducens TaxID=2018668 RepID=A0ABT8QX78_9FIRM|nr:DUF6125 family protein [Desulfosporosinus nitroreducens]